MEWLNTFASGTLYRGGIHKVPIFHCIQGWEDGRPIIDAVKKKKIKTSKEIDPWQPQSPFSLTNISGTRTSVHNSVFSKRIFYYDVR
jgi:hypothetical protein